MEMGATNRSEEKEMVGLS